MLSFDAAKTQVFFQDVGPVNPTNPPVSPPPPISTGQPRSPDPEPPSPPPTEVEPVGGGSDSGMDPNRRQKKQPDGYDRKGKPVFNPPDLGREIDTAKMKKVALTTTFVAGGMVVGAWIGGTFFGGAGTIIEPGGGTAIGVIAGVAGGKEIGGFVGGVIGGLAGWILF